MSAFDTFASMDDAVKAGDQPGTLKTTWEEVTYDEAVDSEQNMFKKLTYWQSKYNFLTYLLEHRHEIEAIVAEHLGLPGQQNCLVLPPDEWIHGSFNACLPIQVDDGRSLIARFPLPYKVGEANKPGNADEKLRCEAAAYAWINQNCPDVPLPRLWGFSFSNGVCVSGHQGHRFIQAIRFNKLHSSALSKPALLLYVRSTFCARRHYGFSAILCQSHISDIAVLLI